MSEENVALEEMQTETVAQEVAPEAVEKAPVVCKKCGKELAEGQKFCPACGTEYVEAAPAAPVFCSKCGTEIPEGSEFCANCGNKREVAAGGIMDAKKKKKLFPILIGAGAALVAAIVIILCVAFRNIPVENIVLDKDSVEMVEQDAINISCMVYPEKATDKTVIWKSSDEKIATVDEFGRITAVGKGECVITAVAGEASAEIDVVVKKKLPDLKALYDEFCESEWADLGSDRSFLSIDSNPDDKDEYYALYDETDEAIEAIHKKLGLPDSLMEDMNSTTWSMGKQEEVFENLGIRVTWTYHPDKGLEVTYKLIVE